MAYRKWCKHCGSYHLKLKRARACKRKHKKSIGM